MRVTDEPGLGVTLNRDVLERLKARRRDPKHDALYLIKSTYENGTVYAARRQPIHRRQYIHAKRSHDSGCVVRGAGCTTRSSTA